MTWEIVVGLIMLVGAVVSIGAVISNNTKAMTEVKCSVDTLSKSMKDQTATTDKLYGYVNDHETRIRILEDHEHHTM